MRELILARIQEFRTEPYYNCVRLFKPITKRHTVEKIIANGDWPESMDFSTMSDENLLKAFEKMVRWNSKQM